MNEGYRLRSNSEPKRSGQALRSKSKRGGSVTSSPRKKQGQERIKVAPYEENFSSDKTFSSERKFSELGQAKKVSSSKETLTSDDSATPGTQSRFMLRRLKELPPSLEELAALKCTSKEQSCAKQASPRKVTFHKGKEAPSQSAQLKIQHHHESARQRTIPSKEEIDASKAKKVSACRPRGRASAGSILQQICNKKSITNNGVKTARARRLLKRRTVSEPLTGSSPKESSCEHRARSKIKKANQEELEEANLDTVTTKEAVLGHNLASPVKEGGKNSCPPIVVSILSTPEDSNSSCLCSSKTELQSGITQDCSSPVISMSNCEDFTPRLDDEVEKNMEALFGVESPKGDPGNNAQITSSPLQNSPDMGFGITSPGGNLEEESVSDTQHSSSPGLKSIVSRKTSAKTLSNQTTKKILSSEKWYQARSFSQTERLQGLGSEEDSCTDIEPNCQIIEHGNLTKPRGKLGKVKDCRQKLTEETSHVPIAPNPDKEEMSTPGAVPLSKKCQSPCQSANEEESVEEEVDSDSRGEVYEMGKPQSTELNGEISSGTIFQDKVVEQTLSQLKEILESNSNNEGCNIEECLTDGSASMQRTTQEVGNLSIEEGTLEESPISSRLGKQQENPKKLRPLIRGSQRNIKAGASSEEETRRSLRSSSVRVQRKKQEKLVETTDESTGDDPISENPVTDAADSGDISSKDILEDIRTSSDDDTEKGNLAEASEHCCGTSVIGAGLENVEEEAGQDQALSEVEQVSEEPSSVSDGDESSAEKRRDSDEQRRETEMQLDPEDTSQETGVCGESIHGLINPGNSSLGKKKRPPPEDSDSRGSKRRKKTTDEADADTSQTPDLSKVLDEQRETSPTLVGEDGSQTPDFIPYYHDRNETSRFMSSPREKDGPVVAGCSAEAEASNKFGLLWTSEPYRCKAVCLTFTPNIEGVLSRDSLDLLKGFCNHCKFLSKFDSQMWRLKNDVSVSYCKNCLRSGREVKTCLDFWFWATFKLVAEKSVVKVIFSSQYGAKFLGCSKYQYTLSKEVRKQVYLRIQRFINDRIPIDLEYIKVKTPLGQHYRGV